MHDPYPTNPSPAALQSTAAYQAAEGAPRFIGRYRVQRTLGQGGFGLVYLAHDDQLQRPVAIKVAHARLIAEPTDAEAYLTEARTVASLDHPNIVPVYDVGASDDFPVFVVSKYIDGTDLFTRLRQSRMPLDVAVELAATVAEALHYAHKQEIVHRDVKPNNILLDKTGKPFVADFGLALREQDVGKGPRYAGTPAYMSPEQARGEGHRVDGRSDIFSLGIVLYELLTGKRPFKGESAQELFEQVATVEVRPLRQLDDRLPKELERICLKALSKRASERYSTAKDMADDLRHWLNNFTGGIGAAEPDVAPEQAAQTAKQLSSAPKGEVVTGSSIPVVTPLVTATTDSQPIKIVPKGLRSFDAHDADFFLELLPGPRDREGLPDNLRFWKTRVDETDADNTFAVGLIYGPSGCGKSSLVKAGLLPRLKPSITTVYIEAAGDETELRLLKALRRQVRDLPQTLSLVESLAALRQGRFLPPLQKVLLVIDQFEQWLHAGRHDDESELVQALRQCDGGRLQSIVMVRDDFWLAVSRFMQALEIIPDGENSRLVDLFDPRHAKKVLTAFGRAFDALPERRVTEEQNTFLDQAVAGLARNGKIISVRLALFAEMVKGKPWTPAALKEVGGTQGVGVTFLEETFAASTAPPPHRVHQKAAQSVLKALLPDAGTDIKGHRRSRQELLAASGYEHRHKDFDDVLRILDGELRLITPADDEETGQREAGIDIKNDTYNNPHVPRERNLGVKHGANSTLDDASHENGAEGMHAALTPILYRTEAEQERPQTAAPKSYQLTHDYLVPSLRDWLTRKQKETCRGRAELLLADRAAVWNARPENRQLPSLAQWVQIKWLTVNKTSTRSQRDMMRRAGRYHAMRAAAGLLFLAVAAIAGLTIRDRAEERSKATHAAGLVRAVLNADTTQTPAIIAEMAGYRKWTDALLRKESENAAANSRQQLHTSLALLPVDSGQVEYLYRRLLEAKPLEVAVLRDALAPYKDNLLDRLWAALDAPGKGNHAKRLRAAAALASYDPECKKWVAAQGAVGNDLVAVPAVHLAQWIEALRPVRMKLLPQLSAIYRDSDRQGAERSLATDILADYAAADVESLAELLMDADETQFAVIYAKFKRQGERGLPFLIGEVDAKLPAALPLSDETREKLAKRRANAAVALLRINRPEKVWPLLKHSADPRVRSYLVHRFAPLEVGAEAIIERLDREPDGGIQRALILSLGEFAENELPSASRAALLSKLQAIYRHNTDAGLHAAAEWLLRIWRYDAWLKEVNDRWKEDKNEREKCLASIGRPVTGNQIDVPRWYVNGQGQTMVVIRGSVEFMMGSPASERDHNDDEARHKRRIDHSFAIASKAVTLLEYRNLTQDPHEIGEKFTRFADLPAVGVNWYMAAKYCNLLSEAEGVPESQWCYEANDGEFHLRPNYLELTGYRLPAEAEMEYAIRAGAATSRFYGETDELLGHYAWYTKNSRELLQRVGLKKPNDFGLFDVQGNCFTWCQDAYVSYPRTEGDAAVETKEGDAVVVSTKSRVLRGGSFFYPPSLVRSAYRVFHLPTGRRNYFGIRVARTLPPIPLLSH